MTGAFWSKHTQADYYDVVFVLLDSQVSFLLYKRFEVSFLVLRFASLGRKATNLISYSENTLTALWLLP